MDHQITRANYDRLSRWYDLLSGSSERPARLRGLHLLGLQPGERVLEIGCGTGDSLPTLASRTGHAGCVIGLDLSMGMLRVAKSKSETRGLSTVIYLQGDGSRLPFGTGSLDAIFMSFTLELFPAGEIPGLLQECKRVLHPGGRLGIVSLMQKDPPGWMERSYNWAHRHWSSIIDCRPIRAGAIMERAGFEISQASEMSMWGLAVEILVASCRKSIRPVGDP